MQDKLLAHRLDSLGDIRKHVEAAVEPGYLQNLAAGFIGIAQSGGAQPFITLFLNP